MASKVLVPAPAPFAKLQVKKSPPDAAGPGFIIGGDAAARVSHLEHSVRFLQEQHRLMLSGLHAEIEALRERNRDLQFQLIFNKESSPKPSPLADDSENSEEAKLKREVARLEKEAASARSEARAAEARALQLQRLVDAQAEKLRSLELTSSPAAAAGPPPASEESESGAALRVRLAEAERLVRRLRADADCRRRELQCMKNSLHASLRATGLDQYGYQNNYHFPPVHTPDFWREPIREDYGVSSRSRGSRRPLTLPELSGQQINRPTIYANNHTRPRANGYENKHKRQQSTNGEVTNGKTPDEPECCLSPNYQKLPNIYDQPHIASYPELKIVVTKMIPHGNVSNGQTSEGSRPRPRRPHRKHAPEQT